MAVVKNLYTRKELAELLGLGALTSVTRRAKKEGWLSQARNGQGGGKEWLLESMPEPTRQQIALALMREAGEPEAQPPALPEQPQVAQLTARQRDVMLARLAFVREIERQTCIVGKERAIRNILTALDDGSLPEHLLEKVAEANFRYGDGTKRSLSRRRLYDWCSKFADGGEMALAPAVTGQDMSVPAWASSFLKHYQKPQKPTLTDAYNEFCKEWQGKGLTPSVHAVRRWVKKVALPELMAGRATGNALLALRPYKRRLTDELWPGDVYTADGTTFDAEIAHPYHGQPFKPEVTFVVDVATRMCVGVSAGVSESALTILDALRMACLFGGIPAMLYSDNGSGYRNQLMERAGTGMLDRLGIELANAIPGRPQGKGLMERAVATLTISCAKSLATCTHVDMDVDAGKKVFKLTREAVKNYSRRNLLPLWSEFLETLKARIIDYNETPHRGLPKAVIGGVRRHYSPAEYWQHFQSLGWEAFRVPQSLEHELFMPGEHRKVRRGIITFYNGEYFSEELADFHGDMVEVRHDIWDPSYVVVYTLQGEKICTAELDGNTIPYFPPSRIEAARAKREKAQILRLEKKAERIVPGARIELPVYQEPTPFLADSVIQPEPVLVDADLHKLPEQPIPPAKRPMFAFSSERYRFLARNPEAWTPQDYAWLAAYVKTDEYADYAEAYENEGIACAKVIEQLYTKEISL